MYGTGERQEEIKGDYLGAVQLSGGLQVYHIFISD